MAFDVTLNGVGYMLQPGSYRSVLDGTTDPGAAGRGVVGRRLLDASELQLGSTTGISGLGLWPVAALEGGAVSSSRAADDLPALVGPTAARQAIAGSIPSSEPKLPLATATHLFIAAGTSLYRWARVIGTAAVNRKTLPEAATCMTRLRDTLWIGYGAAADVGRYDDSTNTLSGSALGGGVQASLLATFSRGIALVAPDAPENLHYYYGNALTTVRTWQLDGTIRALTQHGERLVVATDAGLHLLSGSWHQDTDPPAPPESLTLRSWGTLSGQLQAADDFAWLLVYQGRLLAWLGQRVMQFDEARGWWQPLGLAGAATFGATVSAGWLLTTILPRGVSNRWQLWGYDGRGWWLLDEISSINHLAHPATDGAGRVVTFRASSGTLSAYDLADTTTATTLRSPAVLTTPLLDASASDGQAGTGQRAHWRRLGVEFARTDGLSVGIWTAALEYSVDGGSSWLSAGTPVSVQHELQRQEWEIDALGSALRLRLTLTRVSGLPPAVRALWAESSALDIAARRRWQFKVLARSRSIDRDGAGDVRSGQQMRADLWGLWSAASITGTLTFRDVDYAAIPQEHQVRLLALREEWPKPADAAIDATTTVEVVLQEV